MRLLVFSNCFERSYYSRVRASKILFNTNDSSILRILDKRTHIDGPLVFVLTKFYCIWIRICVVVKARRLAGLRAFTLQSPSNLLSYSYRPIYHDSWRPFVLLGQVSPYHATLAPCQCQYVHTVQPRTYPKTTGWSQYCCMN